MKKRKYRTIVLIKEDLIYGNLSEKARKEIRREAVEAIKKDVENAINKQAPDCVSLDKSTMVIGEDVILNKIREIIGMKVREGGLCYAGKKAS